jgi:four helix bundle protein
MKIHKSDELEEKLEQFGEKIIELAKKVPKNTITIPILDQLVRAGTSIGANYMEANGAASKKDFRNKIHICKKEAKETMHWLRMLAKAHDKVAEECRKLWREAKGYAKLFSSIISSLNKKL